MLDESKTALMRYRLEQAQNCLNVALMLEAAGAYKDAANRSYYCIFHAMRAVHAIDRFDSKKHSGVIAAFRQRYIKTTVFPSEFSDMIQYAFRNRGKSDYEDFFVIAKEDVNKQIENAKVFLAAVEEYVQTLSQAEDEPSPSC